MHLRLPKTVPDAAAGAESAASPVAYVVDDDDQVRQMVANVLTATGFAVQQFATAPSVEAALGKFAPLLTVLDLSLRDSDAVEVIRTLGSMRYVGDILLISGHDAATVAEVLQIGENRGLNMLPPLQKPFRVSDLRARVKPVRERVGERTQMTLAAGLEKRWLEVWYQPKVNIASLQLAGAEALIRMRHPDHGILPPSRFLPAAGDGAYNELTEFVIEHALRDWQGFAERGMRGRIAVNVPASVLQRPEFVATLRRHLPVDASFPGLIVEMTEDEAISDPRMAREIAVQLKLYNVHVSIDDFGAGYSSLARLEELPFSEIKLDRSFVRGCADDPGKRQMCEAVVQLARRFDITSVAEGVETRGDLNALAAHGFDLAQGYLFARPMPGTSFGAYAASVQARGALEAAPEEEAVA